VAGLSQRDLADPILWDRSLHRSRQRRERAAAARAARRRRSSAAVAVGAAVAAAPVVPAAAQSSARGGARGDGPTARLAATTLIGVGDSGDAVAAVQHQLGVAADGVFGPITRRAVAGFQARAGLPATGDVDAATWTKLFRTSASLVDAQGRVIAISRTGSAPMDASGGVRAPTSFTAPSRPRNTPATIPTGPINGGRTTTGALPVSAAPSGSGCGSGRITTPVTGVVTGRFGEARSGHAHAGEDIAAPSGTPVKAAQCGTVSEAGEESGYGNLVCVQHGGGVATCYAHLSVIGTSAGRYVRVGEVIGRVGSTGNSTGPHLHFEVRVGGRAVDPEPYLRGVSRIAVAARAAERPHLARVRQVVAQPAGDSGGAQAPVAPAATPTVTPAPTPATPAPTTTVDPAPAEAAAPAASPAPTEAPAPADTGPTAPQRAAPDPSPAATPPATTAQPAVPTAPPAPATAPAADASGGAVATG
jgi:murein DD-endopeptidase MepM/ murein hydrolase activator NlpD